MKTVKALKKLIRYMAKLEVGKDEYMINQDNYERLKKSIPIGYLIFITTTEGLFTTSGGINVYSIIMEKLLEISARSGELLAIPIESKEERGNTYREVV